MSAGDAVRTAARGLGQTLITLGVVLLLFCVYEVYGTNLVTAREQDRLADDLAATWSAPVAAAVPQAAPVPVPAPEPELGEAFARLHAPRLRDEPLVVVEGVTVPDLKKGPGHLPGTALPGQLGNTVISGHRTTYGAPFADADRLRDGDALVVETRDSWFTYRVRDREVVRPNAIEVTLPVPRRPGVQPTERLLTLTTCEPRYSARSRLIVYAVLEAELPKSAGRPPALAQA